MTELSICPDWDCMASKQICTEELRIDTDSSSNVQHVLSKSDQLMKMDVDVGFRWNMPYAGI